MLPYGYSDGVDTVQVQQETLVIWGERDTIVPKTFAEVSNYKLLEMLYCVGSSPLDSICDVLKSYRV